MLALLLLSSAVAVAAANSTTATPTSQAALSTYTDGAFTLPAAPASCTGSSAPLKTSIAVVGSQISIWDSETPFWFFNHPGHLFTFSTNTSGVALGNPFWDQAAPPPVLPRAKGNSFTANISLGVGDGQLIFEVFASNSTKLPPPAAWNASTSNMTVNPSQATFVLNIEGSGPCKNPLPVNQSCASDTLQLNKANWDAFNVDEWFGKWVKSAGPFSNSSSMMTKFSSQFMNSICNPCTYDTRCTCQGSCSSLPNGGKQPDAEKIWLAWNAMENLSDMLNNVWNAITVADSTALGKVGDIGADFIDDTIAITQGVAPEDKMSKANHILGTLAPWLNFAAPFLFPEADIGNKIFSTVLGFTSAMLTLEDKPGSAPITAHSDGLKTFLKAEGFLGDYVTSLQGSLESVHNEIFTLGTNITDYLNGGAFVNRTLLGLDCDTCEQESQAWTMQYLELKVLNYVWWVQNIFISYVPYGTVISNADGNPTEFTESICAGTFLPKDPDLVWCHTDDAVAGTSIKPGMARLTYYDKFATGTSPNHPNPNDSEVNTDSNGTLNMTSAAPGVKSTQQFQTVSSSVQWTFNKTEVMASSLAGFAKYGFGSDGLSNIVHTITWLNGGDFKQSAQSFQDLFQVSATTPGMFTLPVCVSYNLNYWPTIYGTSNKPQGDQWCVCNSPWSVDGQGRKFNSSTPSDLTTLVNLAFMEGDYQTYCAPNMWGAKAPGNSQDKMSPTLGEASW